MKSVRYTFAAMLLGLGGLSLAQPPGGGGPGGPMNQTRKILEKYDKDRNGRLDKDERKAALEGMKKDGNAGGGMKGPRPGGGLFGGNKQDPPKPGPKVAPADVKNHPDAALFDPAVLRTIFIDFENPAWEAELAAFHKTDVEVPATVTVDGKKYPEVGIHFRGMSSYFMVGNGFKRSMNLSFDHADPKQRLYGAKSLNLLNSHEDDSFMSSLLYSHIASKHIPTPKTNFVKVVINGESWGVYVSQQHFNKDFVKENFKTGKGTRWKVPGSPMGRGGLDYAGDDVAVYKQRYEMKSEDDPKAWQALIKLCKTLSTTPADKLEEALKPMLDVEGALWFLALDCGLINGDGYWVRQSDYSIYLDEKGIFHILPHDFNECFRPASGPGMGGMGGGMRGPGGRGGPPDGPPRLPPGDDFQPPAGAQPPPGDGPRGGGAARGGSGVDLDPLIGLTDARKPLRSKLLAVPAWRTTYLKHMRTIADDLDWKTLGPVVARFRALIDKEVEADTRKLSSYEEFVKATADEAAPKAAAPAPRRGPPSMALRTFADERRKFLLEHPEVKKAEK